MNDLKTPSPFPVSTLDQLNDDELLSLLMSYTVDDPLQTTQELLSHYENIANLLDATQKDLQNNTTLSKRDMGLIRLITEMTRRYFLQRSEVGECLSSNIAIQKFLVRNFTEGKSAPGLYVLCLSITKCLTSFHLAIPGSCRVSDLSARSLAQIAFRHNATHLILANYQPEGPLEIKPEEIEHFTLMTAPLHALGLNLQDGFMFTDSAFISLKEVFF